jgi:hypothetical protein
MNLRDNHMDGGDKADGQHIGFLPENAIADALAQKSTPTWKDKIKAAIDNPTGQKIAGRVNTILQVIIALGIAGGAIAFATGKIQIRQEYYANVGDKECAPLFRKATEDMRGKSTIDSESVSKMKEWMQCMKRQEMRNKAAPVSVQPKAIPRARSNP